MNGKPLVFELKITPLSVNACWQGRRFKTPEAKRYDRALALLLPKKPQPGPYYRIEVYYHLTPRRYALLDWDNPLKPLMDALVRQGILSDDRRILEAHIYKSRSQVPHDWMEVYIWNSDLPRY